jgi:integrase
MLQRRVLKPVLTNLGLDDRDLYAARHSFGTRAAQQGMAVTDIAYLMGHTTVDTTIKNYISIEPRAVVLPKIKSD